MISVRVPYALYEKKPQDLDLAKSIKYPMAWSSGHAVVFPEFNSEAISTQLFANVESRAL